MARTTNRTEYCRRQAADCASAAAATKVDNVREAYRNLEQAWLELAPDIENSGRISPASTPTDTTAKRSIRRRVTAGSAMLLAN